MGNHATSFWNSIRDQNLKFFTDKISGNKILWRISVPLATDINLVLGEDMIFEWMGALRWVKSKESPLLVREKVAQAGATQQFIMRHNLLRRSMGVFLN